MQRLPHAELRRSLALAGPPPGIDQQAALRLKTELADQLRFPPQRTTGVLFLLKWQHRLGALVSRSLPGGWARRRSRNFITLLERSLFEQAGIPYRLPDSLDADRSTQW